MKLIIIGAVWCPSCLVMRPRFDIVKRELPEIEQVRYDIDFDEESSNYHVGNILPVMILMNDQNEEMGRIIGEHKTEEIISKIRGLI